MMMKKIITTPIKFLLKIFDLYSLYCLRTNGYLKDVGWFKSFKLGIPVDKFGQPIPWYTYPAISFIEKRIHDQMSVFEYGCGNSTLWWVRHVKRIVSCEHDQGWYGKMKKQVPVNVELHYVGLEFENGRYAKKVATYQNEFDIIVIDGRDRVNCAMNCLTALKEGGVIIWDNSDRPEYEAGYQYLLENGFKQIDFQGIGPIVTISTSTSIFYKDNNCFGI